MSKWSQETEIANCVPYNWHDWKIVPNFQPLLLQWISKDVKDKSKKKVHWIISNCIVLSLWWLYLVYKVVSLQPDAVRTVAEIILPHLMYITSSKLWWGFYGTLKLGGPDSRHLHQVSFPWSYSQWGEGYDDGSPRSHLFCPSNTSPKEDQPHRCLGWKGWQLLDEHTRFCSKNLFIYKMESHMLRWWNHVLFLYLIFQECIGMTKKHEHASKIKQLFVFYRCCPSR